MSSKKTEPIIKVTKVTLKQFLGIISIDSNNKFAVEKMYVKNTDEKTPSAWDKELSKIKGLSYIYNV